MTKLIFWAGSSGFCASANSGYEPYRTRIWSSNQFTEASMCCCLGTYIWTQCMWQWLPLMPSRCRALIKSVQELCPIGVKGNGLTIDGFLVLITKLINDRKLRTLWTMLRTFGYNNDIRLVDEMIPYSSFKPMHDQVNMFRNTIILWLFAAVLICFLCRMLSWQMKLLDP